ncbi:MAG: flagellar hook-basal body complex protein FliE [Bryobacteraceae bacterium]|nr:flagellar hook-basal body complex protein FliE [Bryobacteraceae bacterium]
MEPITALTPVIPLQPAPSLQSTPAAPGAFGQILESAINRVEGSAAGAASSMQQFISGDAVDLHNVALASQKAALDFEMLLQVRNKVVQAYQEVMRLQL